MAMNLRKGFRFSTYEAPEQSPFEKLFDIFQELITHTSGDVDEALDWLRELDKEYELTNEDYTIDDFIEDLKAKGFLKEEFEDGGGDDEGEEGGGDLVGLAIIERTKQVKVMSIRVILGSIAMVMVWSTYQ
jgi:hypothetical protein